MPGFKIASAYVSVSPDDTGFEDELRRQIADASDRVNAEVGLRLNQDAVISLNEDVLAAIDLATEDVKAHVGLGLKGDAVEALDADVKAGVDLVEEDAKVKVSVDPKSSKDVQNSVSGMLAGGIAAGAALAPGLILSAASLATVGLGALVVKSNADVQAEYHKLAADVGTTLSQATAPLVPAVQASLVSVDQMVKQVAPDVKALFADAEPDLYVFTQGVDSAAEQFLPRFAKAVGNSRVIVADLSDGLSALGTGAGDFFDGLTTHAQSTGRGLEDFEHLTGTALGTAGQVIGSFSAAASSALDAIVPAADGVLTVIDKLANPATIGAAGGAIGAKLFGSQIQSGLNSVSNMFSKVATNAGGAGGLIGKVGSAAESAAGGLGSMADVMGGPWGVAVGAGVGLLGGLVSAFRDSSASAADFTAAVQQDAGQVGSNTEAVIQQTLAKQNLSDLNQQLGVDNATLIAYAAGDSQAQEQVTAAYDAKSAALNKASEAQGVHSKAELDDGNAAQQQGQSLDAAKERLDQVTSAVAQAVEQQNEQTQALLAAQKATDVFTQQVDAQKLALQQSAQTALVNATALNDSLAPQGMLTTAAIQASLAYQQTASATNAYSSALTALYGKYGDASAAQASFTTQLAGLKGQITSGKDAVDASTAAGAKNITAFQGVAQAAENYSEKLYEQTGSADQANAALQASAQKMDDAARQAGLTKGQIQELNEELFGVPNVKDIKIALDDSSAEQALHGFIHEINTSHGTVTVYENDGGYVGSSRTRVQAHAGGGYAPAGQPAIFGEEGPEIGIPRQGYDIIPAKQTADILAGRAPMPGAAAAHGPINFNYYGPAYPGVEQRAQMMHQLATTLGAF